MSAMITKEATPMNRLLTLASMAAALLLSVAAHAAAPGITGPTFNLSAQPAYISQPDGQMVYSWGYGCSGTPSGYSPAAIKAATCNSMQIPGPTLIVTEGQTVTVTLTNGLPASAGNTSILFPGFTLQPFAAGNGVPGLLTQEAIPGGTVTYTFTAGSPGTRAYYSGTQGDLQIEMGLYGAIIVLPANVPSVCNSGLATTNLAAQAFWHENDFRLRQRQDLLRPGVPVPVLRNGSQHSHSGAGAGHCGRHLRARRHGMQSQCSNRAVSPGVLHDQWPFDARRHGLELCGAVSTPAV
jgi:FtsP/CotA-like multicopper oxidase with cupredoxin domain